MSRSERSPSSGSVDPDALEKLLETQSSLLDHLAARRPLADILGDICVTLERLVASTKCCVMLSEPHTGELVFSAAPSLPVEMRTALEGLTVDLREPSFAKPFTRAEPLSVDDLFVDGRWSEMCRLARRHGVKSCWSLPLFDPARDHASSLGRLVLYSWQARELDARLCQIVEVAGKLLSFSIQSVRFVDQRSHESRDSLTGLPDRAAFQLRLAEALEEAEEDGARFAVMVVDIDQLKNINNIIGFSVGDYLLRVVSKRLLGCVRRDDTVARAGGDEFLLFFRDIKKDADIALIAKKVRQRLSTPYDFEGHPLFVTTSIGVSVYPWDGRDAQTLIRHAETALSHAKEEGRSDYQIFRPTMMRNQPSFETWSEQLKLGNDLRDVIDKRQLELYYQLKVRTDTYVPCGTEALLRWRHPNLGMLRPMRFLPLAEQTGLILSLGEWVLETACIQAVEWQRLGLGDVGVSVNVSAQQFRHGDLVQTIIDTLEETHLDPGVLELEITEALAMEDVDISLERVEQLHDLGVRISIDDFGTGFSSLSYLTKFPIDALKIDQSFVQLIGLSREAEAIVRSVLSLAENLGLEVVAEGVETDEQLAFLAEHGCDFIQGFYFSKPSSAEETTRKLRSALPLSGAESDRGIDRGGPARRNGGGSQGDQDE